MGDKMKNHFKEGLLTGFVLGRKDNPKVNNSSRYIGATSVSNGHLKVLNSQLPYSLAISWDYICSNHVPSDMINQDIYIYFRGFDGGRSSSWWASEASQSWSNIDWTRQPVFPIDTVSISYSLQWGGWQSPIYEYKELFVDFYSNGSVSSGYNFTTREDIFIVPYRQGITDFSMPLTVNVHSVYSDKHGTESAFCGFELKVFTYQIIQ